ncbi:hypothetical protein ACPC3D_31215 [Streptomyces cellulosae]
MWTLPEAMPAAPTPNPTLPPGWAAEVKFDGWRAELSWDRGNLVLRSRQGTPLADAFPEVRAAAAQLPDRTALDGEFIVWEGGRLAFERRQGRLQRRGSAASSSPRNTEPPSLPSLAPCAFAASMAWGDDGLGRSAP